MPSKQAAAPSRHSKATKAVVEKGLALLLDQAVKHGDESVCARLLARGADAKGSRGGKKPPIVAAAFRGDAKIVKLLLDAGASPNAAEAWGRWGRGGMTSLMSAAQNGSAECARLLLEAGAKWRAVNGAGSAALSIAATRGNVEVARLLVEAGASAMEGARLAARADQAECAEALLWLGLSKASARDARQAVGTVRAYGISMQSPKLLAVAYRWSPEEPRELKGKPSDLCALIEAVGGWEVPRGRVAACLRHVLPECDPTCPVGGVQAAQKMTRGGVGSWLANMVAAEFARMEAAQVRGCAAGPLADSKPSPGKKTKRL